MERRIIYLFIRIILICSNLDGRRMFMIFFRSCVFVGFVCAFASACTPLLKSQPSGHEKLIFCCRADNDLYRVIVRSYGCVPRFDSATQAIEAAPAGGGVLLLADGYPDTRTPFSIEWLNRARQKKLRLFIEYPSWIPGLNLEAVKKFKRERAVVAPDGLGPAVPSYQILMLNGCHYIPSNPERALLVGAHVAGYDKAVYGLPPEAHALLFEIPGDSVLISTTRLSGFVQGRFAPHAQVRALWIWILRWLNPDVGDLNLQWEPRVRPALGRSDYLPQDAERQAFDASINWYRRSGLLVAPSRVEEIHRLLKVDVCTSSIAPIESDESADGSLGVLEGIVSEIGWDGNQKHRLPLRADCNSEVAMNFALDALLTGKRESAAIAANLQDYVYFNSGLCGGPRGNPEHPAYGLIAWGDISKPWWIANYGDDNARVLLGTILTASVLKTDRWDEPILRGILANFRTTGKLGFRGSRIDIADLERNGWRHYADAETVHYSPHFESYLWACYLWAYDKTGYQPFLETSRAAIGRMMQGYPNQWLWKDNIERARMLLCLAWLIRADDQPQHREWLYRVASELLERQVSCGGIQEWLHGVGGGHYKIPQSNAEYGTGETPLIQQNGDPVCDTLYTLGFAMLGLHEAAAATGDAELKAAEDRLTAFLCRIQARSESMPTINGAWLRAFDFDKWDFWASPADVGWGPWSVESGWGHAWITAVMGLRLRDTSFWEIAAQSRINEKWQTVQSQMSRNNGAPWK